MPTPANTILLQAFEWNVPADKKHFKRLLLHIEQLRDWGVNTLWIPPACKAASPEGNGYDCYDLYDLGEFDQKGTTATKWGSKEELIALGEKAKELRMGLYWDAVLNHKAGADDKEKCKAQEVDQNDRNEKVSEVYEINGWLKFDFNGRKDKYSKQKYHCERACRIVLERAWTLTMRFQGIISLERTTTLITTKRLSTRSAVMARAGVTTSVMSRATATSSCLPT